jgi:acyl-CoA thioester hydrolase
MSALLPQGGVIDAGRHAFPIRVYYEDTDAGGIVYHAAYLLFAERARTEFMRGLGWPHERLAREAGCFWAVRHLTIDYRQPARLDDALVVTTTLAGFKGASVQGLQVIRRGSIELARITVRLAILSLSGRPARMPLSLRAAMLPHLASKEGSSDTCKPIP